ncbi:MAG: aminotransferase class IV [Parvularculaceae bacterium]
MSSEINLVWRNGSLVDAATAIDATDRAYLIGEGAFETMLILDGAPVFLREHLVRLNDGLSVLGLGASIDAETIAAGVKTLFENSARPTRAVCRLTVSRYGKGRGLAPPQDEGTSVVMSMTPAPPRPQLLRLVIAENVRYSASLLSGFKCTGAYAENALARAAAGAVGADEALMLNEKGRLASASAANVFIVSGNDLLTPPVEEGAMPGVMRAKVMKAAKGLGIKCRQEAIEISTMNSARILLTNSLIGVALSFLGDRGADADAPAFLFALRKAVERVERADAAAFNKGQG